MSDKFVPFDGEIIEDDLIDEYDEEGQYNPPTIPQHSSFESTPAALRTPPTKAFDHNKPAVVAVQPFDVEVLADAYDEENPTFFQSFITDKTRFNILVVVGALLILLMMGILAAIFVTSFFVSTTDTDNSSNISFKDSWISSAQVKLSDGVSSDGKGYFDMERSQMRVDFAKEGATLSYVIDQDVGYYIEDYEVGKCTYSSMPVGRLTSYYTDHIKVDPTYNCHIFQVIVDTGFLYLCVNDGYIVTLTYDDNEDSSQKVEMVFSDFVDDMPDTVFEPVDCATKNPKETPAGGDDNNDTDATPEFKIKDSWVSDIEVVYGEPPESETRNGKLWVDIPNRKMKMSINFTESMTEIIYSNDKIYSSATADGDCEYESVDGVMEDTSAQSFYDKDEYKGTECNLFLNFQDDSLKSICVSPTGEFVYLKYVNETNSAHNLLIYATTFREEMISSKTFSVAKGCKKKKISPAIGKRSVERVGFMQAAHRTLANQEAKVVRRRK